MAAAAWVKRRSSPRSKTDHIATANGSKAASVSGGNNDVTPSAHRSVFWINYWTNNPSAMITATPISTINQFSGRTASHLLLKRQRLDWRIGAAQVRVGLMCCGASDMVGTFEHDQRINPIRR
jgi:hypothetical protein